MNILKALALIAILICVSTFSTEAQNIPKISMNRSYFFAYGGVATGSELQSNTSVSSLLNYDYDSGAIFGFGIGEHSNFLGGSRFEFEGLHFSNELDSYSIDGTDVTSARNATGEIGVTALMANVLKEFRMGSRFRMFAGGGLGYGQVNFEYAQTAPRFGSFDSSDSALCFQGIAGFDFCLSPKLMIFTQYKYVGFTQDDATIFGITNDFDAYATGSISVGLRFCF